MRGGILGLDQTHQKKKKNDLQRKGERVRKRKGLID